MLIVAQGSLCPELVERVQRFRGAIYCGDGAHLELVDGRHIEPEDEHSYHIVEMERRLRGCIRYEQLSDGLVHIGGWAVCFERRGTRVAIKLARACLDLAEKLGDCRAIVKAGTRHNSAAMLRRFGGQTIVKYFDSVYRCEVELMDFWLADVRKTRPAA